MKKNIITLIIFLFFIPSVFAIPSKINGSQYQDTVINLFSGSYAVPPNILGQHFSDWPYYHGSSSSTPAPTYNYQYYRTHDNQNVGGDAVYPYDLMQWANLQYGDNDFTDGNTANAWAGLDQIIDYQYSQGKRIIFTVFGTPAFCQSNTSQVTPYGVNGITTPPTSNTYLTEFVTQLVTRYNTDSIRNNNGAHKIWAIEEWNEPAFVVSNTSYFTGTQAQLAAMAKAEYQAAKSVDSSILVFSPGFSSIGSVGHISNYLSASDGDSGTGATWMDALAIHPYDATLPNFLGSPSIPGRGTPSQITSYLQTELLSGGLSTSFPIYATEQGIDGNSTSPIFTTLTDYQKAEYIFQISVLEMVQGWNSVIWYEHDSVYDGKPSTSALVSQALNLVSSLAGKTIIRVDQYNGRTMVVTCSDGTVVKF